MRVGVVRPQRERRRQRVARGRQVGQRVLCAAQQLPRSEVARLQLRSCPVRASSTLNEIALQPLNTVSFALSQGSAVHGRMPASSTITA